MKTMGKKEYFLCISEIFIDLHKAEKKVAENKMGGGSASSPLKMRSAAQVERACLSLTFLMYTFLR